MKKYFFVFFLVVFIQFANGDNDKIDSKLDFQESKENSNRNDSSSVNRNTKTSSPKIQGVRVTVNTGNMKKSKEIDSNESIEVIDNKNTRKIGIHTDITFEITDDKDNKNATTNSESDDNDASVPVFKGRSHTSTKKPVRKPYDPRDRQWPGQSPTSSSPNRPPIYNERFYPNYNPSRIPVYTGTGVRDSDIYRSVDSWSNFVPITSVWTTERTYYPVDYRSYYQTHQYNNKIQHYQPSLSSEADGPQWKPCYCLSEINNSWKFKRHSIQSAATAISDKLGNPFSDRKKRK